VEVVSGGDISVTHISGNWGLGSDHEWNQQAWLPSARSVEPKHRGRVGWAKSSACSADYSSNVAFY